MNWLRRLRFDHAVTVGCAMLLGYFAWHTFYGPRGLGYQAKLETKLAGLKTEQTTILGMRHTLEHKVLLMRPDHVDPDMLEELARSQLDMAGANDLVMRTTP